MTRTYFGVLAGLALAAALAVRLESREATGVIGGYLFGASVGLLSLAWQHHAVRVQPGRALAASVQGFLIKLGALLLGGLALRFFEPVAAVADWKTFVLAFLGAVLVCLFLGSLDVARVLKERSAL
jgi:hypothetical protein